MKSSGVTLKSAIEQMIAHAQSKGTIPPNLTITNISWRLTPEGKEAEVTLSDGDTIYFSTKEPPITKSDLQ